MHSIFNMKKKLFIIPHAKLSDYALPQRGTGVLHAGVFMDDQDGV